MPPLCTFRHEAMNTVFEIVICPAGLDEAYAEQAARAAFMEIDRLEDELSRFRPGSDIWKINHLQPGEAIPVGLATLDCLQLSLAVHAETAGAFDITIGPLMQLYCESGGSLREPSDKELAEARARVGSHVYELDAAGFVRVEVAFPILDLGAVGKGYALDQAAIILQEWSVTQALLNAGESSVLALEAPTNENGWPVSLGNTHRQTLPLVNRAVSGSGFHTQGGHIMNPRLLQPVPLRPERVWASAPTAALSDALSTAFMVMAPEEVAVFCQRHAEVSAFLD